jgi:hypothetical protein
MAVKFSQFLSEALGSNSFLVGYNSVTNQNVRVSYANLVNAFVGGSGTTNYITKWTGSTALGNSLIYENGTRIGINTDSPNFPLTRNGVSLRAANSDGVEFLLQSTSAANASNVGLALIASLTDAYMINRLNGVLGFGTNNSEKMRLTANGRLLIGTTTESTYELDVVGDIRSTLDANINGLTVGKGLGSVANNTALGSIALNSNTTGDYNTAVGRESLTLNTTGVGNIGLGWSSGRFQQVGNYNLYLGYGAGYYDRGSNNIFLGFQTGFHSTFSTSSNNLGLGHQALFVVDADYNIGLGFRAGNGITTGTYNTILGSGTSANGLTTGSYNTIIGSQITGLSSSLSNTIILADGQGNQRLYINSNGSVGVGTTSPSTSPIYRLHVVQSANQALFEGATQGQIRIAKTSTGGMDIVSPANSELGFYSSGAGAYRMYIASTGNVLIGTTTDAGYKLQVSGTTQTTALRISNGSVICDNTFISDAFVLGGTTSLFFYNNSVPQIRSNRSDITVYFTLPQLSTQSTFVINDGGSAPTGYKIQKWMTGSVEKAFLDKDGNFATLTSGLFGSIGTINASAVLEATSTTKGFLPPRMTGAQAEAIGTPAAGLLVYANNGNGTTITSTGWWGYDGAAWVKLN